MAKVVAVINQKGGVGKTTTAFHMGTVLRKKGNKVLFIDMDPQCNLSYIVNAYLDDKNIFDCLMGEVDITDTIQHLHNGDIVISNGNLSSYELKFHGEAKEYRIKQILAPIQNIYDYIIIDSPPALSVLTVAILTASNSFIVPSNADSFSAQGVEQLAETIEAVKAYTNSKLVCDGVLLTRLLSKHDNANASKVISTAHKYRFPIFRTIIHESLAIRGANAQKKNLYDYGPNSVALLEYKRFVEEWLDKQNGN